MALFDRIINAIKNLRPPKMPEYEEEPGVPGETPEEQIEAIGRELSGYLPRAQMVYLVRKAGRDNRLLHMHYNNMWRHVEPYSFRDGRHGQLLYGHCLTHNDTHSFYMHRITGLQLTDIPFSPRWTVEF